MLRWRWRRRWRLYHSSPLCAYTYMLASANCCLCCCCCCTLSCLLSCSFAIFLSLFHSFIHTNANTYTRSRVVYSSFSFSHSLVVHTITRGPFKICNNMLNNWAYTLLYYTLYASIIILLRYAAKQFLFDEEERQQSNIDIRTMKTNYSNRSCNDFLSVLFKIFFCVDQVFKLCADRDR